MAAHHHHAHHGHGHGNTSLSRTAWMATLHCLTGCAIGRAASVTCAGALPRPEARGLPLARAAAYPKV